MRKVLIFFVLIGIALATISCGSATEVGNPTDVPRPISGMIDESTLPEAFTVISDVTSAAIDPADLTVRATAEDFSEEETGVESDGYFYLTLYVGETYEITIWNGETSLGPISFEDDDLGNRSNYLDISEAGDTIELGNVTYSNGVFRPQHEPRRNMGR